MACLHCPGALYRATYLGSLEVMAPPSLFLSSKCCGRTAARARCVISGDLSPLSIRERVAHLQITFPDTRQLCVICVTPLLTCGKTGFQPAEKIVMPTPPLPPRARVFPNTVDGRRRSASSFQGLVNLWLKRLPPSLDHFVFNQHLPGLIILMVN